MKASFLEIPSLTLCPSGNERSMDYHTPLVWLVYLWDKINRAYVQPGLGDRRAYPLLSLHKCDPESPVG
jgi:hypothetical protein